MYYTYNEYKADCYNYLKKPIKQNKILIKYNENNKCDNSEYDLNKDSFLNNDLFKILSNNSDFITKDSLIKTFKNLNLDHKNCLEIFDLLKNDKIDQKLFYDLNIFWD